MGIFSFFQKPTQHFSPQQREAIINAIRNAEKQTSGEIRIFIENKNPLVNTIERAATIFYKLKMQETEHRNGVLLYLAVKHREVALFGDEGIHNKVGTAFWEKEVQDMLHYFRKEDLTTGIINCITHVGQTLKEQFPYEASTDKNELPDDIVFGS